MFPPADWTEQWLVKNFFQVWNKQRNIATPPHCNQKSNKFRNIQRKKPNKKHTLSRKTSQKMNYGQTKIKYFKSMRDNFKRLILSNSYHQQYHIDFEIPGKRLGWVEAIMEIDGQLMNY